MKTKFLLLFLMATLLPLGSGCALFVVGAAAGAGAGTYAFIKGELKSSEAVAFPRAVTATEKAFKDLDYAVVGKQQEVGRVKLTARTTGDQKVQVTLEKFSETVTEIRVRVDTFGDEALSRQVLEKIKSRF